MDEGCENATQNCPLLKYIFLLYTSFFFLCQIVRQDAEVLYYVLQLSLKSAKQDFSLGVASPLKRMAGLCQYDN